MATTFTTVNQTAVITEVSDIVVTDVVFDVTSGFQIRSIRIYGSDGLNASPVLEIRVQSSDANTLRITTPAITF